MATNETTGSSLSATNKRESSNNSKRLILLLLTSGFFIVGLLFDYMPNIVDNQIKRTVELATNAEIQSIWSRPPVDFHSYYWLYEILNPEKFQLGEEKVRVRRVGPYHFTSRLEKRILNVSQNKYRIIYNSSRHIYLDETNSAPKKLDEPMVLLNPVYASLVAGSRELSRDQDPQARQMMLASVARLADRFNESLFINTTARSALLGRKLLIVEKLLKMIETFGLDLTLPESARNTLFGYVSVINGTWDGPFEIYTGYQASMNSLGDIISYQGRKRLTEFQGKCNRLQASAGELRPMPLNENQTLEMYQPRFCRIVHLNPTGTRKLKEGLAISYELSPSDFSSAQTNPDNRCFCINATSSNYCSLNGALELGPCNYHSPIVATASNIRPDDRISSSVLNWDPDMLSGDIEMVPKADNQAQMLVLKRLGVPLQGDITLTLFMRVIRDPAFRQTSQVPEESFIPILTVRERGMIPPKLGQIIVNLESFLSLTSHLKVVMYLTSVVLLCSLTGHYYTKSSIQMGPRITPTDADQDDDHYADQQSAPAGDTRNRSSRTGARMGGRVALPASGAPSERANSADSSRSQPPSRVSHSSLDAVSLVGDPLAAGDQQLSAQTGTSCQGESQLISGPATAAGRHRAKTAKRALEQQAKIFSRLEEESESRRSKRQANLDPTTDTANGLADSSSSSAAVAAAAADLAVDTATTTRPSSDTETGRKTETDQADGSEGQTKRIASCKRNWFMKVCSNFVRMLNGIRSSINDAGQLDTNENDYQDKQLEMLAGKIDSWYQSSPASPDSSLPTSYGGPTGANCLGPAEPRGETGSLDSDRQRSSGPSDTGRQSGGPETANKQDRLEEDEHRRDDGDKIGDIESDARQQCMNKSKAGEADGDRKRRANKKADEEEDAGIGSEGEETLAPIGEKSSTSANSRSDLGPRIVQSSVEPDKVDEAASDEMESSKFTPSSRVVSGVSSKRGSGRAASKRGANGEPTSGQIETEATEGKGTGFVGGEGPLMLQQQQRRDSVQSDETVINKTTSSLEGPDGVRDSANKWPRDQQILPRMVVGPMPVPFEAAKAKAMLLQPPSQPDPELQSNVSSRTVGELSNELAHDKMAALESVERALAQTNNRIEGY